MSSDRIITLTAVISTDRGNHFALVDKVMDEFQEVLRSLQPHAQRGVHFSMTSSLVEDESEEVSDD